MKYHMIVFLLALLVVSCSPAASDTLPPDTVVTSPSDAIAPVNPLAPKPSDGKLTRGNVFIQKSELLIRESFPPQISLALSGDLPTPCYELRAVVSAPDQDNKINVDVYSVVDPDMICTQVLKPFQENIDLGAFPSGHYTVWINGELIGEFDS